MPYLAQTEYQFGQNLNFADLRDAYPPQNDAVDLELCTFSSFRSFEDLLNISYHLKPSNNGMFGKML